MNYKGIIDQLEAQQIKTDITDFHIGDSIKVHIQIIEGDKKRVQVFAGTVIGRKGRGLSETFSMHRVSYGEGMERTFQLHSPNIVKIEVVRRGKVRRAKLYYLRGTSGKAAKVKEDIAAFNKAKSKKAQAAAQATAE